MIDARSSIDLSIRIRLLKECLWSSIRRWLFSQWDEVFRDGWQHLPWCLRISLKIYTDRKFHIVQRSIRYLDLRGVRSRSMEHHSDVIVYLHLIVLVCTQESTTLLTPLLHRSDDQVPQYNLEKATYLPGWKTPIPTSSVQSVQFTVQSVQSSFGETHHPWTALCVSSPLHQTPPREGLDIVFDGSWS